MKFTALFWLFASVLMFGQDTGVQLCMAPLDANARQVLNLSHTDNLEDAVQKAMCTQTSSNNSSNSGSLSLAIDASGNPQLGFGASGTSANAYSHYCSSNSKHFTHGQALSIFKQLFPDKAYASYDKCVEQYWKTKAASNTRVQLTATQQGDRVVLTADWMPDSNNLSHPPIVKSFLHEGANCNTKKSSFIPGRALKSQYADQVSCVRQGRSGMIFSLDTRGAGTTVPILIEPLPLSAGSEVANNNGANGSCVRMTQDNKFCAACEFKVGVKLNINEKSPEYICANMKPGEPVRAQFKGDWVAEGQTQFHLLSYSIEQPEKPCGAQSSCSSQLQDPIPFWSNNDVHAFATVPTTGDVHFYLRLNNCLRYHSSPTSCSTTGFNSLYVAPYYGSQN